MGRIPLTHMQRLTASFASLLVALLAFSTLGFAAERPNVVFILADDLGWADLGCYGSTFYQTPNLDRLAREGIRFTDAYAACNVCSPTRASILTGKYPARVHLTDWLPGRPSRPADKLEAPVILQHLPLEEFTLAEALRAGGYSTCFIGKWHLGGPGFYPEQQGFDINIGGCEKGHPPSYFSPYNLPTLRDGPKGEYLNERLTDEALKFLEQASRHQKPFLLYFAHYAVHTPLQAKPGSIAKYEDRAAHLPPPSGPEFLNDNGHRVRQIQKHPTYAAMVESLDQSVGHVLRQLQKLGLDTNTIVFFTSDNGGLSTAEGWPTSNLPLRAGKGWPYEGGVREPLLVKWPGVTRPGSVCREPVISTDFYPTILQMADLPLRPAQHKDGVSLAPLLRGDTLPARPLFWHYPHYSNQGGKPDGAVREGDWKLIEWFEDSQVELYNLSSDPGEQHNLALQRAETARALHDKLHAWREAIGAQMPTPNPRWDKTQ
jgi:arylsulfatase A-like enzyme